MTVIGAGGALSSWSSPCGALPLRAASVHNSTLEAPLIFPDEGCVAPDSSGPGALRAEAALACV